MTTTEIEDTETGLVLVAELRNEIGRVRDEVAALRHQMRTEVRTRRLVVVDKNDREVIVGQVLEHAAEFTVHWVPTDAEDVNDDFCVTMYAGEENIPSSASFTLRSKDEYVAVGEVTRAT